MATSEQYNTYIAQVIGNRRIIISKELNALLIKKFGIKDDHARKIVQRAVKSDVIQSSNPLTFGNGQFAYFKKDGKFGWNKIKLLAQEHRKAMFRFMEFIDYNGGIISYYDAYKITAAPIEKSSTKADSLNQVVVGLKAKDLIKEFVDGNGIKYFFTNSETEEEENVTESKANHEYSKMITDATFTYDILRWLRKCNIIDNFKTVYRNKSNPSIGVKHNNLLWDAFAYTNTTGINPYPGINGNHIAKQTFVALDVVLSREYTQMDVDGFYSRIQIHLNSVKDGVRRIMPIIVYKSVSPEVLKKISSLGFMAFDLGSIFGTRIYSVVDKLNDLYKYKVDILSEQNIEATIDSLLQTIRAAGQEESLRHIRGVLFEFLLFPVLKSYYGNSEISQGVILRKYDETTKKIIEHHEYDYIIKSANPNEILIVELKGYTSSARIAIGDTNTKNTLKYFFRKTFPFAQSIYQKEQSEGKVIKACFITTASFFADGFDFLEKINQGSLKPTHLETYYDGESLLKLVQKLNFLKASETLKLFFLQQEDPNNIPEKVSDIVEQNDDTLPF